MTATKLWLVLPAMLASAAQGAEVNRSWDELIRVLEPGRNVVVVQHGRKQTEGKLISIVSDAINVERGKQPVLIPKEEVWRVRFANIRRTNTLVVFAAGAALGAILGAAACPDDKALCAGSGGLFFGGIGAAVGGVIPIGKPLYEDPSGLRRRAP